MCIFKTRHQQSNKAKPCTYEQWFEGYSWVNVKNKTSTSSNEMLRMMTVMGHTCSDIIHCIEFQTEEEAKDPLNDHQVMLPYCVQSIENTWLHMSGAICCYVGEQTSVIVSHHKWMMYAYCCESIIADKQIYMVKSA